MILARHTVGFRKFLSAGAVVTRVPIVGNNLCQTYLAVVGVVNSARINPRFVNDGAGFNLCKVLGGIYNILGKIFTVITEIVRTGFTCNTAFGVVVARRAL